MTLPAPAAPFEWVATDAGLGLVCRTLESFAAHIFTTRAWALGNAAAPAGSETPWTEVARTLDVSPARLTRVRQVHGAGVAVARDSADTPDADIIVSCDPERAVAIRVADCVPLLLVDRRTGAVAAAHAGWRGLALRVPEAAVAALVREYGCRRSDLLAAIGPSIGACCYEVGGDVHESFSAGGHAETNLARWFRRTPVADPANPPLGGLTSVRDGRWFLDTGITAREQLAAAGLPPEQVFAAGLCTASHPEVFCSYRRDGRGAGRLAAAIRRGSRRPLRCWRDDPHARSTHGERAGT
jgi:YfiH family protein